MVSENNSLACLLITSNKGMDKIKNATALIPAALFLYFGAETMYSSFIELMYEPTVLAHEHDYSMWPFIVKSASQKSFPQHFLGVYNKYFSGIEYSVQEYIGRNP